MPQLSPLMPSLTASTEVSQRLWAVQRAILDADAGGDVHERASA